MKTIKIIIPVLVALAMSTFTACSDSSSNSTVDADNTNRTILNATEDANVSLDAQILSVSTEQAQVKLTRDVEAEIVNVYVISGSVEVTEASTEE